MKLNSCLTVLHQGNEQNLKGNGGDVLFDVGGGLPSFLVQIFQFLIREFFFQKIK